MRNRWILFFLLNHNNFVLTWDGWMRLIRKPWCCVLKKQAVPGIWGFTLLEVVMVISVMGIIMGVGAPVMLAGYRAFFLGSDIQQVDARARLAMERMVRELHGAKASPLPTVADLNRDLTFRDKDNISVTFNYVSSSKEILRNSDILAQGVTSNVFTIISGSPPMIKLDLTVSENGQNLQLHSEVTPRN